MIVSAQGSVQDNADCGATAQITCIVAATGLAFSTRPVSQGRMIIRIARKHIFFLKIWFGKKYACVVRRLEKTSSKSGKPEINGPPEGSA